MDNATAAKIAKLEAERKHAAQMGHKLTAKNLAAQIAVLKRA